MGKGDQKSKRGKIKIGSYGVRRPRNVAKKVVAVHAAVKEVEKAVEKTEEEHEVKAAAPKRKPKATETK